MEKSIRCKRETDLNDLRNNKYIPSAALDPHSSWRIAYPISRMLKSHNVSYCLNLDLLLGNGRKASMQFVIPDLTFASAAASCGFWRIRLLSSVFSASCMAKGCGDRHMFFFTCVQSRQHRESRG